MDKILTNFRSAVVRITSANEGNKEFGTGFLFHRILSTSYVLTCAHVIDAVGHDDSIRIDGKQANLVVFGEKDGLDLAVLAVDDMSARMLLPISSSAFLGQPVSIIGFSKEGVYKVLKEVTAKLYSSFEIEILDQGERTEAWYLSVEDSSPPLLKGYSGSPVIDQKSNTVVGIAIAKNNNHGIAISTSSLTHLKDKGKEAISFSFENNRLVSTVKPIISLIENTKVPLDHTANLLDEIKRFFDIEAFPNIEERLPNLAEQLSLAVADGLIKSALLQGLFDWRDKGVRTLEDLEPHIENLALQWLQLESTKQELNRITTEWILVIWDELIPYLQQIIFAYQLPNEAIQSVSTFRLGDHRIVSNSIYSINSVELFTRTIDVALILLASLTPVIVIAIASMSVSIVPYLVAVIATALALWRTDYSLRPFAAAANQLQESLTKANLPKWIRKIVLSDKEIEKICAEQKPAIVQAIKAIINEKQQKQILTSEIVHSLRENTEKVLAEFDRNQT